MKKIFVLGAMLFPFCLSAQDSTIIADRFATPSKKRDTLYVERRFIPIITGIWGESNEYPKPVIIEVNDRIKSVKPISIKAAALKLED